MFLVFFHFFSGNHFISLIYTKAVFNRLNDRKIRGIEIKEWTVCSTRKLKKLSESDNYFAVNFLSFRWLAIRTRSGLRRNARKCAEAKFPDRALSESQTFWRASSRNADSSTLRFGSLVLSRIWLPLHHMHPVPIRPAQRDHVDWYDVLLFETCTFSIARKWS